MQALLSNWRFWLFFALLVFVTIYLRSFALDYPSVGFHNEKENEWLAVTKDYYHNGFSTCKRILHHEGARDLPCFENPQLAFIAIVGALSWHIFGESIALVRMQMILYMLLSVLLCYGIAYRITRDKTFAGCAAVIYTLLPLNIFFGRTVNEAAPANFFMMLSLYLFLLWKERGYRWRYSVAAGASLALAGMIKMPFILPAIALLGVFPYKDFYANFKTRWFLLAGFLSFVVLFGGFLVFLQETNLYYDWRGPIGGWNIIKPFYFLAPEYWTQHWLSHKDVFFTAYSNFFSLLIPLGFIVCLLTKNRIKGFVFFYFVAILITYALFGHFLKSQNYYSLSLTFGLALMAAFTFYAPLQWLRRTFPAARSVVYLAVLLPFLSYAYVNRSVIAQFNTQFPGGDIAGTLVAVDKNSSKQERMFFIQHANPQAKSVCYYAFMTCVDIFAIQPEQISAFEQKYHIKYFYVDAYYWQSLLEDARWSIFREHYAVSQIGYQLKGSSWQLSYILLKRGSPYRKVAIERDNFRRIDHYYYLTNVWTRAKARSGFYVAGY